MSINYNKTKRNRMKKIVLILSAFAVLLFTGCSEKAEVLTLDTSKVTEVKSQDSLLKKVYFGFDEYNLVQKEKDVAVTNAEILKSFDTNSVTVFGNTDEWGSDEYNYALGLKRANSVKDVLVSNGVKTNVTMVSLGESNPVCTEKTKECWADNRRVEHELEK